MKNFLFIIQYDSFAKTLIPVIDHLLKNNYNCDVILLKQKFYKKPWLSDKILKLFENVENNLTIFGLYSKRKTFQIILKNKYDVITIGTSYTAIIPKIHKYLNQNNLKAKLVSGYVGALLKNNNEGFIICTVINSFVLTHHPISVSIAGKCCYSIPSVAGYSAK